jgi:hypothetical protein
MKIKTVCGRLFFFENANQSSIFVPIFSPNQNLILWKNESKKKKKLG